MTIQARIDYAAARERLHSLTETPALREAFEEVAATGEVNETFLTHIVAENISLDHLFRGTEPARLSA